MNKILVTRSCSNWVLLFALVGLVSTNASADKTFDANVLNRDNALDTSLLDAFESVLGCALLGPSLTEDLVPAPVYAATASACTAVANVQDHPADTLFTDSACQNSFSYTPTTFTSYCARTMDKQVLGNAADLDAQPSMNWTLSQGTLFDFGALSLKNLAQPFMTRVKYKSIQTAGGTCDLEMRIYKQSPSATGLKSLIAFHGGSWTSRGFGFFGTEMTVPHYTNTDFVVFAPFYRLLDEKEGNPACHNATIQQVTEDADDALQWVVANADTWGGNDYPVVFGQSAGAHLAASLAVNKPEQVANAVLFYPPTDFTDFALEVQNGNYVNEQGLDILERVVGQSFDTVNLSASPIAENSFPAIVEANPDNFPPMYMLHGLSDELVEARQSIRLCGALSGNAATTFDIAALVSAADLRQIEACDNRGSTMHLIKEGGHALDVCLVDLLSDACPSGSPASVSVVSASVERSISWANEVSDQRIAALQNGGTTDGTTTTGTTTAGTTTTGTTTTGTTTTGTTTTGTTTTGTTTDDSSSGGGGSFGPLLLVFLFVRRYRLLVA